LSWELRAGMGLSCVKPHFHPQPAQHRAIAAP
jgi:hypothetical protein